MRSDAIFANSPIGGEWLIGASWEIWALAPDGAAELLGTYTPRSAYWPWPSVSPDRTMLAFSVEEGGALYFLETGQLVRFHAEDTNGEPAALSYFAWSADSQTLYYSLWPQVWQLNVSEPSSPQLIAEDLPLTEPGCSLVPGYGLPLPDGRLLMDCYVTQRSTSAVWDMEADQVLPLTYEGQPIHVWDVRGNQILFDTGPRTSLLLTELGMQSELQEATVVRDPEISPNYSQPMFLPDGSVVVVAYESEETDDTVPQVVVLRQTATGYKGTILAPAAPDAGRNLVYEIAVYGNRLIVEASDASTGESILSDVPLDGSPATVLAEGTYQIVIP